MPDLTPISLSLSLVSASSLPLDARFATIFKGDPGKNGEPGADGMPADLRANMSKLEGKHSLRDIYRALQLYHGATSTGAPTGLVGIGCWGDSVGPHVWAQFLLLLLQAHEQGGKMQQTALGVAGTGTPVTTGTVFDSSTAPIDQNLVDGTGGTANFTYLPSGDHYQLSNGATLTVDVGLERGWATVRVYFAKGPGMGTAQVQLLDADNADAVLATQSLNLADTQLGGAKVQFTADPKKAYKFKVTATGTVIYLRGGFMKAYGLVPFSFARGGSILSQNNYASTAIVSFIMGDLNLKMMFLQAKEENAPVNVPATFARFASLPATSVLTVGSLPDSSDAASQIANNAIFRTQALANDSAYFDGYGALKDYAELTRLGWNGDGTHPTDEASRFAASLILGELNLIDIFGTMEHRDVENARTQSASFRIPAPDGSGDIEFAAAYGGGDPRKAKLTNVAVIVLGEDGDAPAISQRDSQSVTILKADGSIGNLYIANIEQFDENQQVFFAGKLLHGREMQFSEKTLAELGNVDPRCIAFAANGRKVGEPEGGGTGVPCYYSNGSWRLFGTDAVVTV